jgi:hypothetical protein
MNLKRHLPLLVLLALTNPAFAQHGNRGGRPGGGAVHPGAQRPMPGGGQHPMTPQQHENFLHQQMINDQLMFEAIMNSRSRPSRPQGGAAPSGSGKQPTGNNRPQPNSNRPKNATNSAKPGVKPQSEKKAESPGNVGKQTKQEREKEAREKKEADASKKRKEEENSIRRNEVRKGVVNNRNLQGFNQVEINHLKNAYSKMSRADHDYGGHRIRSMEHVAGALEHLGAISPISGIALASQGNLPQAQSDQLLREAEFHLKNVLNTIGTGKNTLSHHHNARASVEAAIRELHVALRIN